ncbi:MAG: MOSC domain-containing protein [Atribacterota bacterium]|nr:MOSC domain-containing protein [Atribacterota bacterium]
MNGKVLAVCLSKEKGTTKKQIKSGTFLEEYGLQGDAHSGNWHRQVSLLGIESINKIKAKGFNIKFGDFAENITTEGIDLPELPIGTKLRIGENALLEITQIGKSCHNACEIKKKIGDCVMPREGVFARVLNGGSIQAGDSITITK